MRMILEDVHSKTITLSIMHTILTTARTYRICFVTIFTNICFIHLFIKPNSVMKSKNIKYKDFHASLISVPIIIHCPLTRDKIHKPSRLYSMT